MLSVPVHKDVGEYQPKIIGKLTLRSLVCTALALVVAVAVGAYSWFVLGISTDYSQYVIFAAALPVWAAGFWRPKGMMPEEFAPLWLAHTLTDNRILYVSPACRLGLVACPESKPTKAYAKLVKAKGIEAYEPTAAFKGGDEDGE